MINTGSNVRLGTIGGHRVFVDLIAFGIWALIVFGNTGRGQPLDWPTSFMVAAFLSVLIHELGHAYAYQAFTRDTTDVVVGLGGYALVPGLTPRQHIFVSLAGPGVGILFGLAGWLVASLLDPDWYGDLPWQFYVGDSIWLMALNHFIWLGLLWSLVNLVPAYPVDGGQALRSLLIHRGLPAHRARKATRRLSLAILGIVALLALQGEIDRFFLFLSVLLVLPVVQEAVSEGW